jgi:GrpB-like predicted nucleotidyltransferase (UPF0157 family)
MTLLDAPDPRWHEFAQREIDSLIQRIDGLVAVHHVGSTSVPGLPAKPILDLLPVFRDAETKAVAKTQFEALGYEWLGEHGLSGRDYARKFDPKSGKRVVHAHCYVSDHPDITRHLAFRDALRNNATLRAAYTSVKAACASRHPEGGAAYGLCKSEWIDKAEARALARIQETSK